MIRRISRESRGRAAVGGGLLLSLALIVGLLAAVAAADDPPTSVGGVTYRHDVVEANSAGSSTVDVRCPAGTHVSGGGSYSESGTGGQIQTSAPRDGADADHHPDDLWRGRHYFSPFEVPQGLNAHVICVASGVTYVSKVIVLHSGYSGTAKAPCGPSRHVTGGGAVLSPAGNVSWVNSTYPWDSRDSGAIPDDGWAARAYNGTGGDANLRVWAACTTTSPTYWFGTNSIAPGSSGFARSACPNTRHLVGAGGQLSGPAIDGRLATVDIGDGPDADHATDDTVVAGGRVSGSSPATRNLIAFAVCR